MVIPEVQFRSVGLPEVVALHSRNCQDLSESPWVIHKVKPGPRGKAGEVHICASHIKVKVSKDQEVYSYASKPISFHSHWALYMLPPNFMCPPCILPCQVSCLSIWLTWLSSVCKSSRVLGSSKKHQYNTRTFLVPFSLWSPNKWNSNIQWKVDQLFRFGRSCLYYAHLVPDTSQESVFPSTGKTLKELALSWLWLVNKGPAQHQKFFSYFSLGVPNKGSSTTLYKAEQYMCIVNKESLVTCPFTCFL